MCKLQGIWSLIEKENTKKWSICCEHSPFNGICSGSAPMVVCCSCTSAGMDKKWTKTGVRAENEFGQFSLFDFKWQSIPRNFCDIVHQAFRTFVYFVSHLQNCGQHFGRSSGKYSQLKKSIKQFENHCLWGLISQDKSRRSHQFELSCAECWWHDAPQGFPVLVPCKIQHLRPVPGLWKRNLQSICAWAYSQTHKLYSKTIFHKCVKHVQGYGYPHQT